MLEPEEREEAHRRLLADQIKGALLTARTWIESNQSSQRDRRFLEDVIPALERCASEVATAQITIAFAHRLAAAVYVVGALAGSESRDTTVGGIAKALAEEEAAQQAAQAKEEANRDEGQKMRDARKSKPEYQLILRVSQQVVDEMSDLQKPWKGFLPMAREICRRLKEVHGVKRDEAQYSKRLKNLLVEGQELKAPASWGAAPEK